MAGWLCAGRVARTMRPVQVSFAKLFNLGDFQNHRIEITAYVPPDVDPQQVLQECEDWVQRQHDSILGEERRAAQERRDLELVRDWRRAMINNLGGLRTTLERLERELLPAADQRPYNDAVEMGLEHEPEDATGL